MSTNVKHNAIARMSNAAKTEFPKADYLIAVNLPDSAGGKPVVTVYAGDGLEPKQTDLTGIKEIPANNGKAFLLMPEKNQMLQITHPDASVQYCTNRPSWRWLSLLFTEL